MTTFLNANYVKMTPFVYAEWNQNLYNSPYVVVSGDGINAGVSLTSGSLSVIDSSSEFYKVGFETNLTDTITNTSTSIATFNCAATLNDSDAYKVVFYAKADAYETLVLLNASVDGVASISKDVDSLGWTKFEIYAGWNISTKPSAFNIIINAATQTPGIYSNLYITTPEVYKITPFDYQYGSMYSAYSPFKAFRPGETKVIGARTTFGTETYVFKNLINSESYQPLPVSQLLYNPKFFLANPPTSLCKFGVANDIMPYQYFVSSEIDGEKIITAKYEQPIQANKLILKFNTIMSLPTIDILIDGSSIGSFTPSASGALTLYYDGTGWFDHLTSDTAIFNDTGNLSIAPAEFSSITVSQTSATITTAFSDYSASLLTEMSRMQLIEVSPRLEIDLSNFVESINVNKSLDSNNEYVPISSINSNDASITLSAIPLTSSTGTPIALFSNDTGQQQNVIKNMLRKNVKFYVGYVVANMIGNDALSGGMNSREGIFYSDSWSQSDADNITIQAYDITRYLQTTPVPDYVANMKSVFDVISNILELAGFTDYDYDSLYTVCNDPLLPLDLAYYYCNSKDTTILDALSQIFLAYQIGAYIDTSGVMKFLSLSNILYNKNNPTNGYTVINDFNIVDGSYSFDNGPKPGKVSLRYQPPKIKQSKTLQSVTDPAIAESPSYILTTSNDVVWSQQSIDSVGFNYLDASMTKTQNYFMLKKNDLLDIFHTYDLNNNGYAIIENEIVSFDYKEYTLSNTGYGTKTVLVKNAIELSSEINQFNRQYSSKLKLANGTTQKFDYDVTITPTGKIGNVKRGMFNSIVSNHSIVTSDLNTSKGLTQATTSGTTINAGGSSAVGDASSRKISMTASTTYDKLLVYPTTNVDLGNQTDSVTGKYLGYQTYVTKFEMEDNGPNAMGLFFNMGSTLDGTYFIEIIKYIAGVSNGETRYGYTCVVYYNNAGTNTIIGYSDITSIVYSVSANFPKVLQKDTTTPPITYSLNTTIKTPFTLKATHFVEDVEMGNVSSVGGRALRIFLNNFEITNWQVSNGNTSHSVAITSATMSSSTMIFTYNTASAPGFATGDIVTVSGMVPTEFNITGPVTVSGNSFTISYYTFVTQSSVVNGVATSGVSPVGGTTYNPVALNTVTKVKKSLTLPTQITANTKFGGYSSVNPVVNYGYGTPTTMLNGYLTEISATQIPLKANSANAFYQDKATLSSIIQGQNLLSKTYCMQTDPEVIGINYYDVQYTNPAAINVDVLPIEYIWHYFPGDKIDDQKWFQTQYINEDSLAYSTPINTGFRARMMIANNSPHLIFLNKESDQLNQFSVRLNLWTHEIIAQSDQEILEKVIDVTNSSEVAQIDSEWIQSKKAAERMLSVVSAGIDGFSKNTTVEVFGNPDLYVGQIISLTHSLVGIFDQMCIIHSIENSFSDGGLTTKLNLKTLKKGTLYSGTLANWTVTYDGNGATSGEPPLSMTYTGPVSFDTKDSGSLAKTGYGFIYWNTAADGSGTYYDALSTYPALSANTTLYAQWSPAYSVIYNGNGATSGTPPVDPNIYTDWSPAANILGSGSLAKTGYTFDSWNTAADGSGDIVYPGDGWYVSGSDLILYAQWVV